MRTDFLDSDYILLKKLAVSDISFLSLDEKIAFERHLDEIAGKGGFSSMVERISGIAKEEIFEIVGRKPSRANFDGGELLRKALLSKRIIENFRISSVFYGDGEFPAMLTKGSGMSDPPYSLFYRGNLGILGKNCVSVVGTRRATPTAKTAAFDFARDASDSGFSVISGLAFGIDIESHRGALASRTPSTAAVLPGGIDTIVPSAHSRYAAKILEGGGLLMSECLPGTPAEKFRFVQRNRIVAALSPATLVVQAPPGSGSMITAGLCLDYNRELFFHSVAFDEMSMRLDVATARELFSKARGSERAKISVRAKIDNTPAALVDSGARVAASFQEYRNLMYGPSSCV